MKNFFEQLKVIFSVYLSLLGSSIISQISSNGKWQCFLRCSLGVALSFSNHNLLSHFFGFITRSLTFRTRFDMHACRKTLLGYLEARAAEFKETPESRHGENSPTQREPVSQPPPF